MDRILGYISRNLCTRQQQDQGPKHQIDVHTSNRTIEGGITQRTTI